MKKLKRILFVLLLVPSLVFGQATGKVISNKPSGGSIGTAATTVDIATLFNVNQTTASQTLTVPNLTVASSGKLIYINNIGSASFILSPGGNIPVGYGVILRWDGVRWSVSGIGSASGGSSQTLDQTLTLGNSTGNQVILSPVGNSQIAIRDANANVLFDGGTTTSGHTLDSTHLYDFFSDATGNSGSFEIDSSKLKLHFEKNSGTGELIFDGGTSQLTNTTSITLSAPSINQSTPTGQQIINPSSSYISHDAKIVFDAPTVQLPQYSGGAFLWTNSSSYITPVVIDSSKLGYLRNARSDLQIQIDSINANPSASTDSTLAQILANVGGNKTGEKTIKSDNSNTVLSVLNSGFTVESVGDIGLFGEADVYLETVGGKVSLSPSTDFIVNAGDDATIDAVGDITLESNGGALSLIGETNVLVTSSTADVNVIAEDINVNASDNLALIGNNVTVQGDSIFINSDSIIFNHGTPNKYLYLNSNKTASYVDLPPSSNDSTLAQILANVGGNKVNGLRITSNSGLSFMDLTSGNFELNDLAQSHVYFYMPSNGRSFSIEVDSKINSHIAAIAMDTTGTEHRDTKLFSINSPAIEIQQGTASKFVKLDASKKFSYVDAVTSVATGYGLTGGTITTTGTIVADTSAGKLATQNYVTTHAGTGTVTSIATSNGITGGTITGTGTISGVNAAADGSTKGVSSYTATDFDATSGNISIDYTNGQAASASNKGFLTTTDWTTFNNKQATVSATKPISITANVISIPAASATDSGFVTTRAQTFAGVKTFSSTISGSINGNAATVTTNANLTGDVTSVGNSTTLATVNSNVGSFTNGSFTVNGKGLITAASSGSAPEVPLTFSTGLTRSTNTITANLAVGVSGGQTAIGGTGVTDALTFKSTTGNATTTATAFSWTGGNNGATTIASMLNNGTTSIGPASTTALFNITTAGGVGTIGSYIQNTNSVWQSQLYLENNRGSLASYGGFSYGGSANVSSNLFGLSRADKLFLFADGASNLGMGIGTLGAQPVTIGTNNTPAIAIDGSQLININNGATTNARQVRITQGTGVVNLGNVSNSTSFGMVGFGTAAMSLANAALYGDGNSVFLNSNTSVNTRISGTSKLSVDANTITWTPGASTSGSTAAWTYTAPANTGQTAATEANSMLWDLSAIMTHASNTTIATQRDFYIKGRTHAFASAGGGIITDGFTLYADPPLAGTNTSATSRLWAAGFNGRVGIATNLYVGGLTTGATALIHLAAGTATASTAPLKFTSGTNTTAVEAGTVEYDGSHFFISPSSTRYQVSQVLIGSASLDFPSTLAGTVSELTITVTGAADGDPVEVGVPNGSMPTTGTFEAYVSSSNTVTVRYANNSLTLAQDPASGTFKVTVNKN